MYKTVVSKREAPPAPKWNATAGGDGGIFWENHTVEMN
jgi:hypothetical protein